MDLIQLPARRRTAAHPAPHDTVLARVPGRRRGTATLRRIAVTATLAAVATVLLPAAPADAATADGRYGQRADVYVSPTGSGDGSSASSPMRSIEAAVRRAGSGGIVELAPGHYGDVDLDASSTVAGWSEPVTIRARRPADWQRAWRIVATEDYDYTSSGEVAASTFSGVWSSSFDDFDSEMTNIQVVGFGVEGAVRVRDARVEFDRMVSAAPDNSWYPRGDFSLTRSVLAWPHAASGGDRMQISNGERGETALLDQVMLGNYFRRNGSDAHADSLQTFTDGRLIVRRSAILMAGNRVQLSSLGSGSLIEDSYLESYGDARNAGYLVPPSADRTSTQSAIMADDAAPTLNRVTVLGSINDNAANTPFTVIASRIRYYGGEHLDTHWRDSVLGGGVTGDLPDRDGNRRGSVDPRRPTEPPQTGSGGTGGYAFRDVPGSNVHAENISTIAAEGITKGCGTGRFCPGSAVTRAQMASFLTRALDLPSAPERFGDVSSSHPHAADIGALAAAGITRGCDTGRFCPDAPVTREQMASFLTRALDL